MNFLKKFTILGKNSSFKETLTEVKKIYPELKLKFPKPPTYIWTPKDEEAKLEPQKIKDALKAKIPNMVWSYDSDGTEVSYLSFSDATSAKFAIGYKGDFLTITYDMDGDSYY